VDWLLEELPFLFRLFFLFIAILFGGFGEVFVEWFGENFGI
jgi:hypothetical protein